MLDPHIDDTIALRIEDLEWREALEVVARAANCQIVQDGPGLLRLTRPPTCGVSLVDANIRVVVDLLNQQANANIKLAPSVGGSVTVDLSSCETWRDQLRRIARAAGLGLVRTVDERGERFYLGPGGFRESLSGHFDVDALPEERNVGPGR